MSHIPPSVFWFIGTGAVLEVISGFVALLISVFSFRYAKMARDARYNALGYSFMLLFLGFLAEAITLAAIVFQGPTSLIELSRMLFVGHAAHVLLSVSGLLVMAIWALKITDHLHRALVSSLVIMLAILGMYNENILSMVSGLLLVFVCVRFYINAKEHNTKGAWEVLLAFVLIAFSEIAFLLSPMDPQWYIGGHVTHVMGFLILLLVLIQVIRK